MSFHDQLLRRALTDGETGLHNEISLRLELERATVRAERYGFPLRLVRIRCDGDDAEAMLELFRRLGSGVRRSDCLARTGTRELMLLLTHEDAAEAVQVAERLGRLCEDFRTGAPGVCVTTEIRGADAAAELRSRLDGT